MQGRVSEVCWDLRLPLSGEGCGGACREELLWARVFLFAWQQTSCISPEQHRAHTPTSAVALTTPRLTWPSSTRTSLLKPIANRRKKKNTWQNQYLLDGTKHLIKTCVSNGCIYVRFLVFPPVIAGMFSVHRGPTMFLWPVVELHVSCHVLLTLARSEHASQLSQGKAWPVSTTSSMSVPSPSYHTTT